VQSGSGVGEQDGSFAEPAGDPAKSTSSACGVPSTVPEASSCLISFGVIGQGSPPTSRHFDWSG